MPYSVTYNGNGNTGGSVPIDSNSYMAGDTVTVLGNTGNLVQVGGTFAYWNTAADGSGHFYDPGATFPISTNVTLYAQWYVTAGLTNGGITTHYAFSYDSALQMTATNPSGLEPARTNDLIKACENDYNLMSSGWFGGIGLPFSPPITVHITNLGGGAWWGPPLNLYPDGGDFNTCRYLLVAEVTEMLMLAQNKGWYGVGNEGSAGEGLSHFLATQFLIANGIPLSNFNSFVISHLWLNSTRDDYVNHIDEYDHRPDPKTACALLFLYYLNVQLGFSIPAIVAAAAPELSGVYRNLTGDAGDPFPFFKRLLDAAFPGTSANIKGPNRDNPYPLGLLSFWVDKSTFGRDEVQDAINTSGGRFPDAFWLVVEGFNLSTFNSLGVTIPDPTGSFASMAGVTISRSATPIDFENPSNPNIPQRIRIAFDITFTDASLASFPNPDPDSSGPVEKRLDAFLSIGGQKLGGSDAAASFELVPGADPYFTNIDPTQNNVFYLSQDLRVFTAVPGQNNVPVQGGPVFGTDSVSGAFDYIQNLLAYLNANYSDPGGPDPFNTILPSQAAALTSDSSVTPFTVDFSNIFLPQVFANYNFAVARVRLRGTPGSATVAQNVRVFFRLWSTQTADTDYQAGSTYPSTLDANGLPGAPEVGLDHLTIPFFATGNLSANTDYVAGGVNSRTVQISTGDSVWAYFGCFLNLYDPANIIDGQQVQHWLNGTHHCIVAQIAYDDAPIVNANGLTASPENSDKLAQRNLQTTFSANPGTPATHRIPQTFDIRPSKQLLQLPGTLFDYPDELMIDWGQIPVGSTASIYWPQVAAADVVHLASRLYGSHLLSSADANTIRCEVVKGVTYVPIPPGTGQNYAGLLTVDLPPTVVEGQEFNVIVRRIATRRSQQEYVPGGPRVSTVLEIRSDMTLKQNSDIEPTGEPPAEVVTEALKRYPNWRYVVGTFQVKIPVRTKEVMLFPEENTLAILKWRLQAMSPMNRWYPVLERYIQYIGARVDGLGGNAAAIQPSLQGVPPKRESERHEEEERTFTGKISGVVYDRFGDFEGFSLLTEEGHEKRLRSREREIEALVRRAWVDRIVIQVYVHKHEPHLPVYIVLRRAPRSLEE